MADKDYPRFVPPCQLNDADWTMLEMKQGLWQSSAMLEDGREYPLCFCTPPRIECEAYGAPCWNEDLPLVVVPKVTEKVLLESVRYLGGTDFFTHLREIGDVLGRAGCMPVGTDEQPQLVLPEGVSRVSSLQGDLRGATARLPDGRRYPINVYHPIRLNQELEKALAAGKPCFAEPGIVVVMHVSAEQIELALNYLYKDSFFCNLRPLED